MIDIADMMYGDYHYLHDSGKKERQAVLRNDADDV